MSASTKCPTGSGRNKYCDMRWLLVPLSWVVLGAVDWAVYGDPLAYARAPTDATPLEWLLVPLDPTVGVGAAGLVLLPWALGVVRTPPTG
jgi:hypothetical protein